MVIVLLASPLVRPAPRPPALDVGWATARGPCCRGERSAAEHPTPENHNTLFSAIMTLYMSLHYIIDVGRSLPK